ncbi:MAG: hypothetical protein LUG88_08730 [Clostridia bacterium]|nr:hypothetical protein [Clostridia bacterium]
MYTSDNTKNPQKSRSRFAYRWTLLYLGISLFVFIFSRVYYIYSHNVHSPYMTFAFAVTLILGALPCFAAAQLRGRFHVGYYAARIYHSGVAAVTVSVILRGVFEIAGTSSVYQTYLTAAGIIMLAAGAVMCICGTARAYLKAS